MKRIEAIIKPFLLDEVKDALQEVGIIGMTISEIKDFSCPDDSPANFSPRLKVEVVVANDDVDSALDTLKCSVLGFASEENLFVQDVDDVIRIRTAEHGEIAI